MIDFDDIVDLCAYEAGTDRGAVLRRSQLPAPLLARLLICYFALLAGHDEISVCKRLGYVRTGFPRLNAERVNGATTGEMAETRRRITRQMFGAAGVPPLRLFGRPVDAPPPGRAAVCVPIYAAFDMSPTSRRPDCRVSAEEWAADGVPRHYAPAEDRFSAVGSPAGMCADDGLPGIVARSRHSAHA